MPSNAARLSDFGSGIGTFGAVLKVDNTNQRIGIGTTNPQSTLQVGVAITMDGAAGVITATTFDGALSGNATSATSATSATTATNAEGLTGTPDITVRNVTGVAATFTGVLTYEDVTNVDSTGIVTARAGLNVVGGGATVTGVSTFHDTVRVGSAITLGASSGIVTATGVNVTGIVTAASFQGSGADLTNLPASGDSNDITASLFL
jgi:hypothetical protein|tara:strand:- start:36 stop:653 length:618 start_codon:yes stop_codon:yes gene_type:complete